MLTTYAAIIVLIVETAFGTFVAARAWSFRPSRLFFYLTVSIVLVLAATLVRDAAPTPEAAYPALAALVFGVSCYITLLMLLLSSLFVPSWWEGARPIVWITLPYLLITAFLALDLAAGLGIVVSGVRFEGLYRLNTGPGAVPMILLSALGQVFCLSILVIAFFNPRHRQFRLAIALLAAALIFSLSLSSLAGRFNIIAQLVTLVQTLPTLAALGYAILGTRLFTPTRTALDLALQVLREAVAVADKTGAIIYANPTAAELGIAVGAQLPEQIGAIKGGGAALRKLMAEDGGDLGLRSGEQHLELNVTPVRDARGVRRGTLLLARDVSDLAQRNAQIERERSELSATVKQLERAQLQREALVATLRSLSLPLIPVLPGVLILPLVGDFAGTRINEFITVLLEGIERQHASIVLIDITGLPLLDSEGAQGLLAGVRAAALLGARCVLVGVRPEVAQSLVSLGLSLDELLTAPTLEQAVLQRLKGSGLTVLAARGRA